MKNNFINIHVNVQLKLFKKASFSATATARWAATVQLRLCDPTQNEWGWVVNQLAFGSSGHSILYFED